MSMASWAKGLSLRGRTLLVGSVVSAALIAVGAAVPIPYVGVGPGVTYNTLGSVNGTDVITFTGPGVPASAAETTIGHLNMTTISVNDNMTLFAALGLWATDDHTIAPREDFFAPNQTVEQVNQANAQLFQDSQSSAEIAALRYLKYPSVTYVGDIPDGSPSSQQLRPQDQITAVDGQKVTDLASLRAHLSTTKPGQVVTVTVLRATASVDAKITLADNPNAPGTGLLGISAQERPKASFTPQIALANTNIGGPSAGFMFTLGLIDKLTPGDLTSGHFIAGTGEIQLQDDGSSPHVGAIGGIQLKEIAARDAGATIFLVPAPNCQEAVARIPAGLTLVQVGTLDDGMAALKTIAAGGAPPTC